MLVRDKGALSRMTKGAGMALVMVQQSGAGVAVEVSDEVFDYVQQSRADSTARAYAGDLDTFRVWCAERGRCALPASPETVAEWVADMAGRWAVSTIARRLAGVSVGHQMAGMESPTRSPLVRRTMEGVRRRHGVASEQHAPAGIGEVRRMVARLDPGTLTGARDRALLLVGFALAARRSELVALDVADLDRRPEGVAVRIRRSKTDQHAEGTWRALPAGRDPETCPVAALDAWCSLAGITEGPLFRPVSRWGVVGAGRLDPGSVARVVKSAAERAGLDPGRYSAHSLRAGFCTTAAANGASDRKIAAQTGHAPNSRVVRAYIRHGSVFTDNAATELGL